MKSRDRKRIRRLERRVTGIESIIEALPSANVSDHIPPPVTPLDLWAEQVDLYRSGGWEDDDWTMRGYL